MAYLITKLTNCFIYISFILNLKAYTTLKHIYIRTIYIILKPFLLVFNCHVLKSYSIQALPA